MRLTGKYRYLTFEDRKKIEAWHLLGDRPVDIAARLSVHHTTIYKELQRGATGALDANQREGYSAELAERRLRESFKRRGKRAPAAQYLGGYGLRPACYLDSDLLISIEDDEATDDVTPEHAGEIIAALAEQFGGTFATEDQLTTALSFMLGTLRATREKEARHE